MLAQHGLLLCTLGCDGTHFGLLHRRPDRARVSCVSLVGLHKRANEFRVQQDDIMTKRLDLACPPMSASAGLERHSTSRALCQKRDQVVASEPAIGNLTGLCINPVHLVG